MMVSSSSNGSGRCRYSTHSPPSDEDQQKQQEDEQEDNRHDAAVMSLQQATASVSEENDNDSSSGRRSSRIRNNDYLLSASSDGNRTLVAASSFVPRLRQRTKRLLFNCFSRHEISGSVGDLGTFLSLYIALIQNNTILDSNACLFWAGLSNLITGYMFDLPLPVQPMKSIATTALLDEGLSPVQYTISGIWMGILLILISFYIDQIQEYIPKASVVSGIQIGVGLHLCLLGLDRITDLEFVDSHIDCLLLAILVGIISMYSLLHNNHDHKSNITNNNNNTSSSSSASCLLRRIIRQIPLGLLLLSMLLVLAIYDIVLVNNDDDDPSTTPAGANNDWSWQPLIYWSSLSGSSLHDWKIGFWHGAIPQLPLTLLNSVVSTCCLANTLYRSDPDEQQQQEQQPQPPPPPVLDPKELCRSVGYMNLLLCPLGAMPSCHGAGGLAGQHQLGARTGSSVAFLGACKMVLAVALGNYNVVLWNHVPHSILGILLIIAGHELARAGYQASSLQLRCPPSSSSSLPTNQTMMTHEQTTSVALLTTAVTLGTKTLYGALTGLVAHFVFHIDHIHEFWCCHYCRCHNNNGSEQTPTSHTGVAYAAVATTTNDDDHENAPLDNNGNNDDEAMRRSTIQQESTSSKLMPEKDNKRDILVV